jgi:hypothetical protein
MTEPATPPPTAGGSPAEDDPRTVDSLSEISDRLQATAERLRSGELEPGAALTLVEECAQLAHEASVQVDERSRAALEPLPDLPGQLPLPAG